MSGISLRNVQKCFGKQRVIHGVDCDVAEGEFVVIVGPSGCGKSTLLRMIAGLEEITAGQVSIGDRVVNDLEPAERDIAMVFQNYALYPHMTVYDNMAYSLKIRRISKEEIRQRVERVAAILKLGDLLERRPRQLSGGQRQRVAMGRAIVREPAVFLFDEPLSNLDAKLRLQMRMEMRKLHQRLRTTSIYVTHDQVEAMTLGQRLMVMNAGVVEQIGTPMEIYNRPFSTFVAGFMGSPSMNLLDARIEDDAAGVLLPGGHRIPLPVGGDLAVPAVGPITLGVRPEHLEVTEEERGSINLVVELVEQLGADTLVHGSIGQGACGLTVRLRGSDAPRVGERLPLAVSLEHVHLFDRRSGGRV